jgi:hypothetical protein
MFGLKVLAPRIEQDALDLSKPGPIRQAADAQDMRPSPAFRECVRKWDQPLQRINCFANQENLGVAERCRKISNLDAKVSCFNEFVNSAAVIANTPANPFDREPDDFVKVLNETLSEMGLARRLPEPTCKPTKLYKACEVQQAPILILFDGSRGEVRGTSKILVIGESVRTTDATFANVAAALLAACAPEHKASAINVFKSLVESLESDGHKGVLLARGVYFSLMQVGNDVHFHAIREE